MFSPDLIDLAADFLRRMFAVEKRIVSAESCTGGLIAALLTEIPGASNVVERGFVTYSNQAKCGLLQVPENLIAEHGAVSEEVARAMAQGALNASLADISIAVTGIAGPGGGTDLKPTGLVHLAAATSSRTIHLQKNYGDKGRCEIRLLTVRDALLLASQLIED